MVTKKSEHPDDEIVLVTVCDDHYVPLLAALLKSIEVNYNNENAISVFIISDSISNRNREKLKKSFSSDVFDFRWLNMKECIPKGVVIPRDYSSYPSNIYTRIFIPDIIPPEFSKVLYMDVDMILTTDITQLWKTSLSDQYVAAAQDKIVRTVSNSWGGILNYTDFSLSPHTPYFNTGLLLINTQKWREDHLSQRIINVISSNKRYANYPDQYGMNVVLANHWMPLDPSWNTFSMEYTEDPKLIHFTSRKPIYKTYKGNASYQELFFQFLNQTAWKNFQLIGEPRRYYKKVLNVLGKFGNIFPTISH